ncbi:MAG: hypothetical protein VX581_07430 [Chloroflexota bacterium]|nr:hypothetical protein [Chloroflexota bacterium]
MPLRIKRRSSVTIVEIHGVIGNHVKIPELSRLIVSVAGNQRLKALLLDVASPGGSATGSEILYRAIYQVAEEKPVYSYVRRMGASDGYSLACAASKV